MSEHTKLLKVSEVAERLSMKESGVRRWLLLRRLPVVKLGRMVRIPVAALDDIIRSSTVPAKPGR